VKCKWYKLRLPKLVFAAPAPTNELKIKCCTFEKQYYGVSCFEHCKKHFLQTSTYMQKFKFFAVRHVVNKSANRMESSFKQDEKTFPISRLTTGIDEQAAVESPCQRPALGKEPAAGNEFGQTRRIWLG